MAPNVAVEDPEVWVGCLACYNAGDLVGEWVDATEAADFVPCTREDYGAPHEEFWVMDFQGFYGTLSGECSPTEAQEIAEALAALPDHIDRAAFGAWVEYGGGGIEGARDFEDRFCGEWDSAEDYARDFAESTGAISDDARWPNDCIDWPQATRELMADYTEVDNPRGGVWIFHD